MKKIVSIIITMLFCFPLFGGCATADQEKIDRKSNISFSPDGKKLLFNRSENGKSYL